MDRACFSWREKFAIKLPGMNDNVESIIIMQIEIFLFKALNLFKEIQNQLEKDGKHLNTIEEITIVENVSNNLPKRLTGFKITR